MTPCDSDISVCGFWIFDPLDVTSIDSFIYPSVSVSSITLETLQFIVLEYLTKYYFSIYNPYHLEHAIWCLYDQWHMISVDNCECYSDQN